MTQTDYAHYNRISGDYDHQRYEEDAPTINQAPRSVRDPASLTRWELTLAEAIRVALSNNKTIAVERYIPGENGADIELNLADFDATVDFGGQWQSIDRQLANIVDVTGTGAGSLRRDIFFGSSFGAGNLASTLGGDLIGITKKNATGGSTRLAYAIDYNFNTPAGAFIALNPAWLSAVALSMEQPLLRGAGVEYNRAPILIARANQQQSIKDFETLVQQTVRDVEAAYWDLWLAYESLRANETGLKQTLESWQVEKRRSLGRAGSEGDVAEARQQFEIFRAARMSALENVLEAEGGLRIVLGLPPEDGRQIVPIDPPTSAGFEPNWEFAVEELMELRPDLIALRFAVRAAELEVLRARNGLLPELTFNAKWAVTGLAGGYSDAVDVMLQNKYTDGVAGVRYTQQVGQRAASANVQKTKLVLSQTRAELREAEHVALHALRQAYQRVIAKHELLEIQRERRHAGARQLAAYEVSYLFGKIKIDLLLRTQTKYADALLAESAAVADYNKALVDWELTKGTILTANNVELAESELSIASPKLLERRRRQWRRSLPIPIFPGDVPHDAPNCPDPAGPLYPTDVVPNAVMEAPATSDPPPAPSERRPDVHDRADGPGPTNG